MKKVIIILAVAFMSQSCTPILVMKIRRNIKILKARGDEYEDIEDELNSIIEYRKLEKRLFKKL